MMTTDIMSQLTTEMRNRADHIRACEARDRHAIRALDAEIRRLSTGVGDISGEEMTANYAVEIANRRAYIAAAEARLRAGYHD